MIKINTATDYAIRVLIFAASHPNRLVQIKEIAEAYAISENHLIKIITFLKKNGYLETIRGRNGGLRLSKSPETISMGEIIMLFEDMIYLKSTEFISSDENLSIQQHLDQAYLLFFKHLNSITLNEMVNIENR